MNNQQRDGAVPWPSELANAYRSSGVWEGLTLGEQFFRAFASHGPRPALVDGEVRLSYEELMTRIEATAGGLELLGIHPRDRVVVQLGNCWELVVLTLACFRVGAIPVMALPAHRKLELSYFAAHSEASALVVPSGDPNFDHQSLAREIRTEVPSVRHVLASGNDLSKDTIGLSALARGSGEQPYQPTRDRNIDVAASDVALFLLSGGTTGVPKLIPRTHNDYFYNVKQSAEVCGFDADTVFLVCLPGTHNFALGCPGLLGTLLRGGKVVLASSPSPSRCFPLIQAEGVTHAAVVPAVAKKWLDEQETNPSDFASTLEVLQVGGSRLAESVGQRVPEVLGCSLQQVYGMAEGLLNYTRHTDPAEVVFATQGRPMSEWDEIRIVDRDDRPVAVGESGMLITQGPYTTRGYYRAPEQNRRDFTEDGWYRTGDICRLDPSGNLVVEGRSGEIINRGGEKISAEEVENLLYSLGGVQLTAVVGMPDEVLGERVCAFVVRAPGSEVTLSGVQSALDELGVARYKWPERLEIASELPYTKMGKIDKKALRTLAVDLVSGDDAS